MGEDVYSHTHPCARPMRALEAPVNVQVAFPILRTFQATCQGFLSRRQVRLLTMYNHARPAKLTYIEYV